MLQDRPCASQTPRAGAASWKGTFAFHAGKNSAKPTAFVQHREQNPTAPPAHCSPQQDAAAVPPPCTNPALCTPPCSIHAVRWACRRSAQPGAALHCKGGAGGAPELPPGPGLGRVFALSAARRGSSRRACREAGGGMGGRGSPTTPSPNAGLGYCASAERNAIRAAGREASKGCEGAGGLGSGLQGVEATRLCPCISPPRLPPSPQPRVPTCCPPAELLCFPLRASFNYCCW